MKTTYILLTGSCGAVLLGHPVYVVLFYYLYNCQMFALFDGFWKISQDILANIQGGEEGES